MTTLLSHDMPTQPDLLPWEHPCFSYHLNGIYIQQRGRQVFYRATSGEEAENDLKSQQTEATHHQGL
jgi:hypothetical protein